jgi:hypothetical protein
VATSTLPRSIFSPYRRLVNAKPRSCRCSSLLDLQSPRPPSHPLNTRPCSVISFVTVDSLGASGTWQGRPELETPIKTPGRVVVDSDVQAISFASSLYHHVAGSVAAMRAQELTDTGQQGKGDLWDSPSMNGLFRLIKAATRDARELTVYETPSWSGSDVEGVNTRSGFRRASAAPNISSAVGSESSRPKGRWLLHGTRAIPGRQGAKTRRRSRNGASSSHESGRGERLSYEATSGTSRRQPRRRS